MIPQALFVPASLPAKYDGAYEVSHMGVVLRVRGDSWEHIGGIWLEHIPATKVEDGKTVPDYLRPYITITHENPVSGKIVEGAQGGERGWFLVPEKYIADFDAAVAAAAKSEEE